MSFKNTLVLLTSNIGSRVIAASGVAGRGAFGSPRRPAAVVPGGAVGELDEEEAQAERAEQVRCKAATTGRAGAHIMNHSTTRSTTTALIPSTTTTTHTSPLRCSTLHAVHSLQARLASLVREEVRSFFRPELLNRFDDQVVFSRLAPRHVSAIAEIMLDEARSRLAGRGVGLVVGPHLRARIVAEGYSHEYGARPLRQVCVCLSR